MHQCNAGLDQYVSSSISLLDENLQNYKTNKSEFSGLVDDMLQRVFRAHSILHLGKFSFIALLFCRVKTWNWICNLQASGKIGGEKLSEEVRNLELT